MENTDLSNFIIMLSKSEEQFEKKRLEDNSWKVIVRNVEFIFDKNKSFKYIYNRRFL